MMTKNEHERENRSRGQLAAHSRRQVEAGWGARTCPECGAGKSSPETLRVHVALAHPEPCDVFCDLCDARRSSIEALSTHLLFIHGVRG